MKKVEIGHTSWRLLMGTNAVLALEAVIMIFTYSLIEGILLAIVSFIGLVGIGCRWRQLLTAAMCCGYVVLGFVAFKLYDCIHNQSSDVGGWFVTLVTAICGTISTFVGTGYLVREKWLLSRGDGVPENSLLDLEKEVQRARAENDAQMDDGSDFGTWNSPKNFYVREDFTKPPRADTTAHDTGAALGMPSEGAMEPVRTPAQQAADNGELDNPWVHVRLTHETPSGNATNTRPHDGSDFGGGNIRGGLF